jgi:hypothetical protein
MDSTTMDSIMDLEEKAIEETDSTTTDSIIMDLEMKETVEMDSVEIKVEVVLAVMDSEEMEDSVEIEEVDLVETVEVDLAAEDLKAKMNNSIVAHGNVSKFFKMYYIFLEIE